jgi:hypothetical protein
VTVDAVSRAVALVKAMLGAVEVDARSLERWIELCQQAEFINDWNDSLVGAEQKS